MVVPAYNEEQRLPKTLREIVDYLAAQSYSWEVLVVDDGSVDNTAGAVEAFAETEPRVRLIRNPHCGKGYAVRTGVLSSAGEIICMCDADLSVPIHEVAKFLPLVQDGYPVAIGSREAPGARRVGEPYYRHLMGRVFNWVVRVLAVGGIQDTQCGFKWLSREAAFDLFPRMRLYNSPDQVVQGPMVTGFDVELLFLARKAGYRIAEVPVEWHYGVGSKVNPLRDSYRNFRDVLRVRVNDLLGHYSAHAVPVKERGHHP